MRQDMIVLQTETLFKSLDISTEHVEQALTALTKHSQDNIFGSSDLNRPDLMSQQDWACADKVFEILKLPLSSRMTLDDLQTLFLSKL